MKKAIHITLLLLLVTACFTTAQAQGRKVIYLPKYTEEPYHFGFLLGANFMDYTLMMKENYQNTVYTSYVNNQGETVSAYTDIQDIPNLTASEFVSYQILSVERDSNTFKNMPQPGLTIGFIADKRLGRYFNLRFTPSFSLTSIKINYTLQVNYLHDTIFTKDIPYIVNDPRTSDNGACFFEFPLHLKYRSARYNNIGAYLIAGANPKLYLRPLKKKFNYLEANRWDFALEVGAGFDIYNQWFKTGVEIKLSLGMLNIMKDESEQINFFGKPLNGFRSKQLQVSFTFE